MGMSDMMRHYVSMKEKYQDCVLFYRLGDFYEMFFDDAVEVSKLLDLTLTGKDCGLEQRAPMCGIPFHAADDYIATLGAYYFEQAPMATKIPASKEHISISNQESTINTLSYVWAGLLRNVKEAHVAIVEESTGRVV